ncbi:MAG TPA: transglycosylase SLT domain-containing protein [Gemmatimonadales bacterium]
MTPVLPDLSKNATLTPQPSGGIARYQPTSAGGEDLGRATAAFGQEASQAGDQIWQAQDHLDKLQAEDALNQLRQKQQELTYDPNTGFTAKLGRNALGEQFRNGYEAQFNQAAKDIGTKLTSERARLYFQQRVPIAASDFQGGLLRHQAQQALDYSTNVTNDSVSTEISAIAADPTNDNQYASSLTRINGVLDEYGAQHGIDVGLKKQQALSNATVSRIESLASTDPTSALDLYDKLKKAVNPAARAPLYISLKRAALPIEARQDAETVLSGNAVPKVQAVLQVAGAPLANYVGAVMNQESGGKQGAVSPKGAIGVMQLMPDTAKDVAKQLGVPFDLQRLADDKQYNTALGGRYLQNMFTRYHNNPVLALAAYNAGPTAVDAWVSKYGDPSMGQISTEDFLARIPYGETRRYVTKVMGSLEAKRAPNNPIDVRANLENWISQAETIAEKRHPGDPVYRDLVVGRVQNYVSTIVAAQQGRLKAAAATLMSMALGQPGQPKPVTTDELLSTPEARTAWAQIDPGSQRGILALLDHNAAAARGAVKQDDPIVLNQLFDRVSLPDGDPNKITSTTQLVPYFAHGLSTTGMDWLTKWIDRAKTPEGNQFLKQVKDVGDTAKAMLLRSLVGQIQPDVAEEAAYRFKRDLEQRIENYRANPEKYPNPHDLFTPGTKDYVLDPAKVASYMPTSRQAVAKAAADKQNSGSTWNVGEVYHFKQGDYQYLGGDAKNPKSWSVIKPASTPGGKQEVAGPSPAGHPPAPVPANHPTPVLEDANRPQRLSEQEDRIRRAARAKAALEAAPGAAKALAAKAGHAVEGALGVVSEAVTPPTPMEQAVTVFRTLVHQGRYRTWNEPQIATALASGLLNKNEEALAQKMLADIAKAKVLKK